MKVRILYVVESLMTGGIESQLVELLLRLDRDRFEPHVLALYGARAGRAPAFAEQLAAAAIPFEILDIGWGIGDKLRAAREIAACAHALRPAFIQLEGYHANLLARALRPLLPATRLIGTVRGLETPKQLVYQRLGQWTCARIVASSLQIQRMLVERAGVPARKIVVIPNAIDVRRFATAPVAAAELRRELAPAGERLLLSVGRVSPQKRLHLIPEALGLLKREGRLPRNVRICLLGQIEDADMQARLEAAIQTNGLNEIVIQRPATATPEVYYHASDATILYTILEGISIAMLESLAAGRPVLLSEEANVAGVVEEGRTGWIVPTHDLARFADALAEVLTMPEGALRAMSAACARRAEVYAIELLVRRYSDLYSMLAGPINVK